VSKNSIENWRHNMSKRYPFVIKQTGPIELTENLGTDPAYSIPVEITILCEDKRLQESVAKCVKIYYHASEGWVPCDGDNEIHVWDLIPQSLKPVNKYDVFEYDLSLAMNELGASVLARLFRLGDALYNKSHADVAIALVENDVSLKPIRVTDKTVKGR
jgi:hypothetical protein